MDEKKGRSEGYIPLPVIGDAVPGPKPARRSKLVRFALLAFHLTILHYFVFKHVAHWYRAQNFSTASHSAHGHGKKPWGKEAEKLFLSIPDADSAIAASRLFATQPHLAGSEGDLRTAKDWLRILQNELAIESPEQEPIFPAGSSKSREATLSIPKTKKPTAWIDVYFPVMNTPLDRALEVIDKDGKVVWKAELEEVADETDPEAGEYFKAIPTFHGLSAAGDVQGKLIYANYGRKEDYDNLLAQGVDFTGAIVIARYGAIFRGLKIKRAQELGAAGVLIYSDLRDDGSVTEDNGYLPYPHGPSRNVNSVQRGSVQFLSTYPGDPTTPGLPAYENATRTEGENIPKIPSLPISAANAAKLLELASAEGAEVHVVNHVDTKVTPIWNTMGVIPGFITDEIIVIGNHRDAWVMGAVDPSSGTSSLHETVRGLGALLKKGWKPLRTIVIASWDAEEYGLIGSTEWVEDFPDFVRDNVVTYLNLDSSVSGATFGAAASPSLSHFIRQVALDVPHPTKPGLSLWDARSDVGPFTNGQAVIDGLAFSQSVTTNAVVDSVGISPLGSGSDFTPFLQWIGVASGDGGFSSSSSDAVYHYHSVFDSERWQEVYGDPGFHRHVAVAKYIGLELIRLSTSMVLPLNTTNYAYELERYLAGIEAVVQNTDVEVDLSPLRKSITALQAASHSLDFEKAAAEKELKKIIRKWTKRNRRLKKKIRRAICRVKKALGRPFHKKDDGEDEEAEVHHLDQHQQKCRMAQQDGARDGSVKDRKFRVGRLPAWLKERHHHQEHEYSSEMEMILGLAATHGLGPKPPFHKLRQAVRRIRAVNKKLASFERGFISKEGIPDREWYRNLAIAPGKWLGYGATPLPALSEAIEFEKNGTLAQHEVGRLTALIDALADDIRVHK
ncbi:Zn-dependent exopeptidase [Mycena kentingensis (nom. inval.)]|nr:Zn-dependent exopeptidase [Mycena kentingensis (nom. inval.)]